MELWLSVIVIVLVVLVSLGVIVVLKRESRQLADRLGELEQTQTRTLEERFSGNLHQTVSHLQGVQQSLGQILESQRSIQDLSQGLQTLNDLMTNKQARGHVGETQLKDIVKDALPAEFYDFQVTLENTKRDSTTRVDCLLKMPEPSGHLAVDSKFPLESFIAYRQASDEASQKQAKRELLASLRRHLRDISEKYIIEGTTADCALMFLPSEAVYSMIHGELPEIVQESQKYRVYIVSPSTMMATVVTLRSIFRDVDIRKRADDIRTRLGIIAEDVNRFNERLTKLGQHFDQTQRDLNDLNTSGKKIVASITKVQDLG